MKEKHKEKLLRLWKIRQEKEGYDVSGVKNPAEAEHFFDKKEPENPEPEKKTAGKPRKKDVQHG